MTETKTAATIGRTVHYHMSETDAAAVNKRRADFAAANPQTSGLVAHVGNTVLAGSKYPAVVVAAFGLAVNLQVLLDGSDSYWATSRVEGEQPGQWAWPVRS